MTNCKPWINLRQTLSDLLRDESGQDLIEYALVAAIIALGATAALTKVSGDISAIFTKIGTTLTTATYQSGRYSSLSANSTRTLIHG